MESTRLILQALAGLSPIEIAYRFKKDSHPDRDAASLLGLPISTEMEAPDGSGRLRFYKLGALYWSRKSRAVYLVYKSSPEGLSLTEPVEAAALLLTANTTPLARPGTVLIDLSVDTVDVVQVPSGEIPEQIIWRPEVPSKIGIGVIQWIWHPGHHVIVNNGDGDTPGSIAWKVIYVILKTLSDVVKYPGFVDREFQVIP